MLVNSTRNGRRNLLSSPRAFVGKVTLSASFAEVTFPSNMEVAMTYLTTQVWEIICTFIQMRSNLSRDNSICNLIFNIFHTQVVINTQKRRQVTGDRRALLA